MQVKVIERTIDVDKIDTIKQLNCSLDLQYTPTNEGIRAIGTVEVDGVYSYEDDTYTLDESIDVDIFAPIEKIDENEKFTIVLNTYRYDVCLGGILVHLEFLIHGIKDTNEIEKEEVAVDDNDNKVEFEEDIWDDGNTKKTKSSYVLCHEDSTYEAIAEKYHVNLDVLLKLNNYVPLANKMNVKLPND